MIKGGTKLEDTMIFTTTLLQKGKQTWRCGNLWKPLGWEMGWEIWFARGHWLLILNEKYSHDWIPHENAWESSYALWDKTSNNIVLRWNQSNEAHDTYWQKHSHEQIILHLWICHMNICVCICSLNVSMPGTIGVLWFLILSYRIVQLQTPVLGHSWPEELLMRGKPNRTSHSLSAQRHFFVPTFGGHWNFPT